MKKRQIVAFVAFYRLFWGATKSYRSFLKKRQFVAFFVAFLSLLCTFLKIFMVFSVRFFSLRKEFFDFCVTETIFVGFFPLSEVLVNYLSI